MPPLTRRRRNLLIALPILLPLGFIAMSIASGFFFVTSAHTVVGSPPEELGGSLVDVSFKATDGTPLRGWFGSAGDGNAGVILLHGYRDDRRQMLDRARLLMNNGYSVLLYDARGCGESEGDLISVGYYETSDLLAAIRLMRQRGVERLACLGVSQGGATVLLAAGRLDSIDCVIIESTYDRIENAIDRRFRHRLAIPGSIGGVLMVPVAEERLGITADRIAPIDSLRSLRAPILVISGEKDTRTTEADTRNLFAAAPEPKELWIIPGADHENLHEYAPEEYASRVLAFLEKHLMEKDEG